MDEVTKRSAVPSAASVCTSVMRACPPILSAASVPGMRSDPGKSPADTTGAGSSGVRCGSWLPRDAGAVSGAAGAALPVNAAN